MARLTAGRAPHAEALPFVTSVFEVDSARVVQALFALHFPGARRVVDLTYGKGRFWAWPHALDVTGIDLVAKTPTTVVGDGRATGLPEQSFDVAVLDPPFTSGLMPGGYDSTVGINADYSRLRSSRDVVDLYRALLTEARRLAPASVVKCKDSIDHSKFSHLSHVVADLAEGAGWRIVDKAVLLSKATLPVDRGWPRQYHLRRQESYFYVLRAIGAVAPQAHYDAPGGA